MGQVIRIAREEWRYWRRTKLAAAAIVIAALVTVASVVSTAWEIDSATSQRQALQDAAETTFKSQPARHPHRMVHYGHYVFRKPAPLAVVDPGVDTHTGTAMFLEGHRQSALVAVLTLALTSASVGFSADETTAEGEPLSPECAAFSVPNRIPPE